MNLNNLDAFKDAMTRNSSTPKIVVSDMDEVLVNITPKWSKMIIEHMEDPIVDPNNLPDFIPDYDQYVLNRSEYYLYNWLGFKDNEFALSLMCEQGDTFYDDLELTPMGKSLVASLEQGILDQLVILSHTPEAMNNTSKINFIKRHFPVDKVRLLLVDLKKSKADAINEHQIPYTTFIDDRLDIVQDVFENTDSGNKEFIMPKLGYNEVPEEFVNKVTSLGSTIGQYTKVCA